MTPEQEKEFSEALEHEDLIQGFRYWRHIAGSRDIPLLGDVDPLEIVPILPYVNLIDVVWQADESIRLRHRLLGTALVQRFHAESTGAWFEDLYTPEHLKRVMPDYETPIHERRPVFGDVSLNHENERILAYRRLIMPLAGPTGSVDRLIAIFAFDNIPDTLRDKHTGLPLHQGGRGSWETA